MIILFPTCEKANSILQPWLENTDLNLAHIHNYEIDIQPKPGKELKLKADYMPYFTRIITGSLQKLNEFLNNVGSQDITVVILTDWVNEEEHPIIKDRHVWVQMNLLRLKYRIKFLFVPLSDIAKENSLNLPCIRIINLSRFDEVMNNLDKLNFIQNIDII